jgi:hypothetical protein
VNGATVRSHGIDGKAWSVRFGLQGSIVAKDPGSFYPTIPGDVPRRLHMVETGIVTSALDEAQVVVSLSLEDRPRAVPARSTTSRNAGRAEHHNIVADGVEHG